MAKSNQKLKKQNKKQISSGNFFTPVVKYQTYLNMLYLLLSFPLGIFYCVFLVSGFVVGIALAVTLTWLGIPILLGLFFAWRGLAIFERVQAKYLLGNEIVYNQNNKTKKKNAWQNILDNLSDDTSWKELAALIIKFPMGIISFVFLVIFLAVSLSFIAAPIVLLLANMGVISGGISVPSGMEYMATYWFTLIAALIGVLLLFASLHIFNFLAKISGIILKVFLEKKN